jgi:hypothetical protein
MSMAFALFFEGQEKIFVMSEQSTWQAEAKAEFNSG